MSLIKTEDRQPTNTERPKNHNSTILGDKNSISKIYTDIRQSKLCPSGSELRYKS